jgi:hypothetical protein
LLQVDDLLLWDLQAAVGVQAVIIVTPVQLSRVLTEELLATSAGWHTARAVKKWIPTSVLVLFIPKSMTLQTPTQAAARNIISSTWQRGAQNVKQIGLQQR